jgi:glutamate/tyrosine decarboxylase-like PLP-dependent enzyme
MRTAAVAPNRPREVSQQIIRAIDLERPIGLADATREAAALMREGDLLSASSRCFGYFNPTAAWPGVVADLLAAARNPQLCVVSHAPASVIMERHVIAWFLDRLGFPSDAIGNFTSGGSEANATALLAALVRMHPPYAEDGLAGFPSPPCFYASSDSHLAWIKIARAAGLGTRSVRLVPTTGDGRLDAGALRSMVLEDQAAGQTPFMIAATAGTTNAGEIDPLHDCRKIADQYGLHLHIDAAWAGALIVDPGRRSLLDGIEKADSVTIDAHKWLSVPMGAGMIFVRDSRAVATAFAVSTGYMPAGDGIDAFLTTSQWSRRFIGLRLWMMLRASGPRAYREMFTRHFEAAEYLRARLPESGWVIRNRSKLPVILFEDAVSGIPSREIADELERDGRVWLGCVEYEERILLRACLTSFLTGHRDLDQLLDRLTTARARLSHRV